MNDSASSSVAYGTSGSSVDATDLASLARVRVGVSTSAFQCEGGLDHVGDPSTNWRAWVEAGRAEPIGAACDLWRRYGEAASRAHALGLDLFRLSIEWARVQPFGDRFDRRAIEGYADRLTLLRDAGLAPIVTVQHFTHPAWLDVDFWLDERAPDFFARYAAAMLEQLNDALARRGGPPVHTILTLNEPNMLALATYLAGVFPHGKGSLADGDPLGFPRALRALDHLMAAHVRSSRAIHARYEARGWRSPAVSTNVCIADVYGVCGLVLDLVRAPGLDARGLDAFVRAGRERFQAGLFGSEESERTETARALERAFAQLVAPELFEATCRLVCERGARPSLDRIAIDVYDPWTFQQVHGGAALFRALARGESWATLAQQATTGIRLADPWEWRCEPDVLRRSLRAVHDPERPLPLDVVENGMSVRRARGEIDGTRPDGTSRADFVRGYTAAITAACAIDRLPVESYCYWTLIDNYELGRYAPRFGLYSLRDDGTWGDRDAAGEDSAAALAAFAQTVRRARASAARAAG